jgi:mannose-6-phosphate isomerase-like protein (cupin superfamily)
MRTEKIRIKNLKEETGDILLKNEVLPGEVEGVFTEILALKGNSQVREKPPADIYDVLFVLDGQAVAIVANEKFDIEPGTIVRMPFNKKYTVQPTGDGVQFLRIRKTMDEADLRVISENKKDHSEIFTRSFEDCPVYTEDIKSSKSVNRMILPEGKVPRFCMGSVETEGPDTVAEHEHPMLDQLFFGLKGCRCTCTADGESQLLTENMLLHIPLGSKHSVSVKEGEKLAYIWFDFFLTIEGQKYMDEQHRLDEE